MMLNLRYLLIIFLLSLLVSCAKDEKKVSSIKETSQDLEMVNAYKEAYKSLDEGDPYFAAKNF